MFLFSSNYQLRYTALKPCSSSCRHEPLLLCCCLGPMLLLHLLVSACALRAPSLGLVLTYLSHPVAGTIFLFLSPSTKSTTGKATNSSRSQPCRCIIVSRSTPGTVSWPSETSTRSKAISHWPTQPPLWKSRLQRSCISGAYSRLQPKCLCLSSIVTCIRYGTPPPVKKVGI
jgi:hypothetical protein